MAKTNYRSAKAATAALQNTRQNTKKANQCAASPLLQNGFHGQLTHHEACCRLHELGFPYTEKVPTAGKGRIPSRGKGANNISTSVKWTDDGQALQWYEFTTHDKGTIFADVITVYSRAESVRLFKQAEATRRKAEADMQALQDKVARQAQDRWRAGVHAGTHAYIKRKQLSGLHNARIDSQTGALLIPMYVSGVGLVNLQSIYPNGTKRPIKGGRVKGAFSPIGRLHEAECVVLTEGWATGATIRELYGLPTVIAFNAGNLENVAETVRELLPDAKIIIAADDDRQTPGNPGRRMAVAAAKAVGGKVFLPTLCKACKCSDHNDAMVCARRAER